MRFEVLRRFFEAIVDQCQQAGLVWGKELYADATKVQANAALSSMKPCFAARAHLAALFPQEVQEKAQEESLQQGKGLDQEVADERMDPLRRHVLPAFHLKTMTNCLSFRFPASPRLLWMRLSKRS
jgi:hypothetical protein